MGVNGIYGLSGSGLDIESLVKVGMLSKQTEYDNLYKKTVKQQWTKEALADIYSDLTTFKYTTLSSYKSQSTLNAMGAESSDSKTVTATANGVAVAMTHTVQVEGLSTNAYLLSKDTITRANTTDTGKSSIKLADNVFYAIKENGAGKYSYQLTKDGQWFDVDGDDTAISFTVGDTKDALTEEQKKTQTLSYTFADLAGGKTYNDMVADINKMGTNVKASYDSTTDSFSLYNSISGSDATISLTAAAADVAATQGTEAVHNGGTFAATLLNNLNLAKSAGGKLTDISKFEEGKANGTTGSEGTVTIDGKTYNNVKDNRITVSGVTYNLLNLSSQVSTTSTDKDGNTVATTSYTPTTVSVSQDTSSIIDTVKKFVEDYNKVLDKLQEKYSTKTWSSDDLDNDYEPLTKTQQASMTSEQIDSWNEKAKSGLLYHNTMVRDLINSMRDAISTRVESVNSSYNSASAIGITSSDNKGHLQLDENKLKTALAADPDCVYQIFANDQDNYADLKENEKQDYIKADDYNNRGIVNRLYYDAVTDGMSKIKDYAGTSSDVNDQTTLGKAIMTLQDRLDILKTKMSDYQTMLYKKYDAMETLISQQNSIYSTIFSGNS